MTVFAILLSGGSGSRMGTEVPKQLLQLDGKEIITYSAKRFHDSKLIDKIIYVANPEHFRFTQKAIQPFLSNNDLVLQGGATRHESFLNAIHPLKIHDEDILLIHDAARPFFTETEIANVIAAVKRSGVATLAEKVAETIVMAEGKKVKKIRDREKKYLIKTPQGIRGNELKQLLAMQDIEEPTDICSWAIQGNIETELVECNQYNLKITHPEDMAKAKAFLPLFEEIK